jgi:hypothetical protein
MIHYEIREHKEVQADESIRIKYAIYEDNMFCQEYETKNEAIEDFNKIMNY